MKLIGEKKFSDTTTDQHWYFATKLLLAVTDLICLC